MRIDASASHRFLAAWFRDCIAGQLVLFTLPRRSVHAFPVRRLDKAASTAASLARKVDVYFGLGIQRDPPERGRGDAESVTAITGLWLDLDVRTSYRDRDDLPQSVAEALAFVSGVPLAPTAIVHSGGGLYPFWVFRTPWTLGSSGERAYAARISRGWQGFLLGQARERGWRLDGTADLARVLRLPGTLNHKTTPAAPVRIVSGGGPRYDRSDFEPFTSVIPTVRTRKNKPYSLPIDTSTPQTNCYVRAAIEAECLAVANSREGSRNNRLNESAFSLARFVPTGEADPRKLVDILTFAAKHAGLPDFEIRRTIASAFRAWGVGA